jgi:hypothetical protein
MYWNMSSVGLVRHPLHDAADGKDNSSSAAPRKWFI